MVCLHYGPDAVLKLLTGFSIDLVFLGPHSGSWHSNEQHKDCKEYELHVPIRLIDISKLNPFH